MPFKSKAQMRRFYAMEGRGELPKGTAVKWTEETKSIKKLPERVGKTKQGDEMAHMKPKMTGKKYGMKHGSAAMSNKKRPKATLKEKDYEIRGTSDKEYPMGKKHGTKKGMDYGKKHGSYSKKTGGKKMSYKKGGSEFANEM